MKNALKIGILFVLLCGFAACDKDESPVAGEAKIIFSDSQKPERVIISTEDGNTIYDRSGSFGNIEFELNAGNYRVQPSTTSQSVYYTPCYFQIVGGRTTKVLYLNYSGEVYLQ